MSSMKRAEFFRDKATQAPVSARCLATLVLCLSAFGSVAANDSLVDGSRTICTHPDAALPRIVQVIYEDPASPIPCRVVYEKDGSVEELAAAKNTKGHCEKIERRVVGNLAKGGYSCKHSFIGTLADADRSVTLDLFAGSDIGGADTTPAWRLVERNDDGPDESILAADTIAAESTMTDRSPSGTSPDASDSFPVDEFFSDSHPHRFTHSHPMDGSNGSAVEHTHVTTDLILPTIAETRESTEPASSIDTAVASGVEDIVEPLASIEEPDLADAEFTQAALAADTQTNSTDDSAPLYAILSQALPLQSDAHRMAAEFRRSFPDVETRVVRQRAESAEGWHVSLGIGRNAADLGEALEPLGPDVVTLFDITELSTVARADSPLEVASSDWARYAIASCWADGNRNSDEIADCADVVLDADAFVDCLGGGLCAPSRFNDDVSLDVVDFASVLGAEDTIVEARDRVTRRLEGCEQLSDVDNEEFAECAALAVLDDDHRDVYDCYQRSASNLAAIECAGNDTMADYARAYDRCGTSGYEATGCLMENSSNDYLQNASYCSAYEDAADITTCALDANLSDDNALLLSCATDYDVSGERALCLAREQLGDSEYASLECAGLTESLADYSLCVGERSGSMSFETLHAMRCLQGTEVGPRSLLECSGGQFVDQDIGECLAYGPEDPRCFEPETLMSQVANDTLEDYLQLAALNSEIARFRQELYALEGGDLADMLKIDGGAGLVPAEIKKARKGLRGLIFGK